WLKSYLKHGPDRPLWAFAADENVINENLHLSVFLQSWNSKRSKLPKDLNDLMKVALKHDVEIEGLAFRREIQRGLTIWYHIKSTANCGAFNRGTETICLKSKHKVVTVGETETLARRLATVGHISRRNCSCPACTQTRIECSTCISSHKCYMRARFLLNTLEDKWNPLRPQPEDYEALDAANPAPLREHESRFNPKITTEGDLTGTFRIFCEGRRSGSTAPNTYIEPEPDEDEKIIYTDGSAINNGKEDAQAGAGVYYGPNDGRNRAIRVPTELLPSNNVGEILAIKEA
ncbi:hypothetical protein B0H19DRAFT_855805, partial [Mycena capillaripes]